MAFQHRIRNVTAVLGPTNTGKTHLAIERMLGHQSGMIGLPLRLLAREVYDKVVARVGPSAVALITGEEKIKPDNPRYWVSTVEAMPSGVDADFLAIDEIQLAADLDRGHVFTDRLLNARGRSETLLLGAGTMRDAISELIPDANFISRPRLSKISYAGQKKITRLPKRSAIVAFSAAEVYSIAELIRRQLGGAAVVMGALSPRTRNAQVALYQSGDVDYLVATDAIGMGLNLDVDHIAFASVRKFDGHVTRNLTPAELGQIAGRAGRHVNDGTFGVTSDVDPLDSNLIEQLEQHTFDTVRLLQWRNRKLQFANLDALRESLRQQPSHPRLQRARMADDVAALESLSGDSDIAAKAVGAAAVERLWEVCQVPDYRKISAQNHAELVAQLYGFLASSGGQIPEDWFAKQVALADRTDGDIDTLATRIAHIRTWTFVSNRAEWLQDPVHWQARTRAIEDSLSDALHEQLTQRFVDKRTSALMKGLRDKDDMSADIGPDGAITVENHFVGRLKGFRFWPDAEADATGVHGKAARGAAAHVLAKELGMRARRVAAAKADAFKLARNCRVLWRDEEIARLEAGDDPFRPTIVVLADDHLTGADREKVQQRLDEWIVNIVADRLKPLMELKAAEDISGLARGIAFRLTENFGVVKRDNIADEMRQLDQPARSQLRKYGVRFGAFNIFLPLLLKPAAAELTLTLWTLNNGPAASISLDKLPEPPRAGLTSVVVDPEVPEAFYRAAGYHACGPRAIRVDMLERLADSIRPLLAWRPSDAQSVPPRGSSGDGGFLMTSEMMSILGCSSAELGEVLATLGFRSEKKPRPVWPKAGARAASGARSASSSADGDSAGAAALAAAVALATLAATGKPAPAPTLPATAAPAAPPTGVTTSTAGGLPPPVAPVPAMPPRMARPDAASASASDAAPGAGSASADEAAEAELVDIWRPQRRFQDRRPKRGDRRSGSKPNRAASGQSEQGDRPSGEGHGQSQNRGDRGPGNGRGRGRDRGQNRNRDGHRPGAATAAAGASAPPPAAASDTAPSHGSPRPDRNNRRDQRRGDDQRHQGGGRGPRREDHRRRDDRGDRNQPNVRSASPKRRPEADPDSPFAALSALKQQLEKQGKPGSS